MLVEAGFYKLFGENPETMWFFLRHWINVVMRMLGPNAGYGVERMPRSGGLVVAANHFSSIDPPAVGIYSLRQLYYMTKVELLNVPIAGESLRMTGSFGVRRGSGDRDAIRVARWVLQQGLAVGMFMEGTRQKFGYPGDVQAGAAMLAMQEGVPVVPCGVDTFGWSLSNRRPYAVVFGDPIDLGGLPRNGAGYKEGAKVLEAEIVRLWRQASEAVAAGLPKQLPDGTPRHKPIRARESYPIPNVRRWPTEPWAKVPLGPIYRSSQ